MRFEFENLVVTSNPPQQETEQHQYSDFCAEDGELYNIQPDGALVPRLDDNGNQLEYNGYPPSPPCTPTPTTTPESTTTTVTVTEKEIPDTGTNSTLTVARGGAILLVAGVGATIVARRRRTVSEQ